MVEAAPLVGQAPVPVSTILQIIIACHQDLSISLQVRTPTGAVDPALVIQTLRKALAGAESYALKLQPVILPPTPEHMAGLRIR